jgi:hypothetical protein
MSSICEKKLASSSCVDDLSLKMKEREEYEDYDDGSL